MNRAWKLLGILSLVPILSISGASAQIVNDYYGGWGPGQGSRNIPAGSVQDPGSQLLYIVDTGVDVRAAGLAAADTAAKNVSELLSITGAAGEVQSNFISLTNTHPTKAVTIHFRYYNDSCEDLLDFLLILTCNDTLIFDPFNFNIPGATLGGSAINTKSRIFGPDAATTFPAIKGDSYGSGRFLIAATAAGTVNTDATVGLPELPDIGVTVQRGLTPTGTRYHASFTGANILFPNELGVAKNGECNIDAVGTKYRDAKDAAATTAYRNVGGAAGLVSTNLHVFNALAVNFNYLIGHQTIAVPKGFIKGATTSQDLFLAFALNAWTRPAIWKSTQLGQTSNLPGLTGTVGENGDGIPLTQIGEASVPDYVVLMGSEKNIKASDTLTNLTAYPNLYYLRQDAHGGDTEIAVSDENAATGDSSRVDSSGTAGSINTSWSNLGATGDADSTDNVGVGGSSFYGALAWASLHTAEAANQRLELLSIVDDYDGSKNSAVAAVISGANVYDRAYNLTGAQTQYILQIYDNDENKLALTTDTPINISPPPATATTANLRIIVDCLNVWIGGTQTAATRRNGLSIANVYEITALAQTGSGTFAGLGATVVPLTDASQGWIRLVRDNKQTKSATIGTRTIKVTGGTIAPIAPATMDNTDDPTFVTIAQTVVKFEGFGGAWNAPSAASAPAISNASTIAPSP